MAGAWMMALALLGAAPVVRAGPAAPVDGAVRQFSDGARTVEVLPEAARLPGAPEGAQVVRLRWADGRGTTALIDNTALIRIREARRTEVAELLAARGLELVRPLMPALGLWLVRDPSRRLDGIALAQELTEVEGITEVVPNLHLPHRAHAVHVPNDPRFGGQWFFEKLKMTEAWALHQGDPETTVVVIDNGCDATHPELKEQLLAGRDVVDGDDDPSFKPASSGNNHGTACAGLIAAKTDNGVGVAGACPKCRLRCVRLLNDSGFVPLSADVDAFNFALETNAAVVSNSWGFSQAIPVPKALADAINAVHDKGRNGKGALVLFASGNDDRTIGDDELLAVRGVMGVGATNSFDEGTPFTNSGNSVDLVAPTGTLTTDISGVEGENGTDYTSIFGGTSSACPVAAGVAGLLASAAPELTSDELTALMISTTRKAPYAQPDAKGHDPIYGYGIVNPVKALKTILEPEVPDAGVEIDAGSPEPDPGGGGDAPEGCGCGAAGRAGPGAALLVLLGLAGAKRRPKKADLHQALDDHPVSHLPNRREA